MRHILKRQICCGPLVMESFNFRDDVSSGLYASLHMSFGSTILWPRILFPRSNHRRIQRGDFDDNRELGVVDVEEVLGAFFVSFSSGGFLLLSVLVGCQVNVQVRFRAF